jgi:Contractile injection system tube protein
MPEPPKLAKATLQEIRWNKKGDVEKKTVKGADTAAVTVQFNPATLKVNYANQKAGGDQPGGSPVQFVGKGTTKLTLELWFDTTVTDTRGPGKVDDVRLKTREIFNFMKPTPGTGKNKKQFVPPGVRFHWGSFIFDGVVDSMDENLEFFSSSGVPMRASVSLAISQQELSFQVGEAEAEGVGTNSFEEAKAGDSLQQMASKAGNPDWKGVALANGIENPRLMPTGSLVNMSATGISASLGGASITAGAAIGASFGVSAGASASLGSGVAVGGASFGGGASLGASASFGATASFGASASFGAGASFDTGAAVGGSGAGASLSASATVGADAGGFSASAEASAEASVR